MNFFHHLGKIFGLGIGHRDEENGYETWVCPKCHRKYKTPTGCRIAAYVSKWDFCPKCLIDRETGKPVKEVFPVQ